MPNHVNTESFEIMIDELKKYHEHLEMHRSMMGEAVVAADSVLGGGVYSQKYVSRVEEALVKITKTMELTQALRLSLQKDLVRIIDATEL